VVLPTEFLLFACTVKVEAFVEGEEGLSLLATYFDTSVLSTVVPKGRICLGGDNLERMTTVREERGDKKTHVDHFYNSTAWFSVIPDPGVLPQRPYTPTTFAKLPVSCVLATPLHCKMLRDLYRIVLWNLTCKQVSTTHTPRHDTHSHMIRSCIYRSRSCVVCLSRPKTHTRVPWAHAPALSQSTHLPSHSCRGSAKISGPRSLTTR
jgi:hypothetical protein